MDRLLILGFIVLRTLYPADYGFFYNGTHFIHNCLFHKCVGIKSYHCSSAADSKHEKFVRLFDLYVLTDV
jgi:hypothetical protein